MIDWKKIVAALTISLIVAFALELAVFNFPHWRSMFAQGEQKVFSYADSGKDLTPNNDGALVASGESNRVIVLEDLNTPVDNVFIRTATQSHSILRMTLSSTDEAHELFWELGQVAIYPAVPASCYIPIHMSGEVGAIRIEITEPASPEQEIQDIEVNATIPLFFSAVRLLLCWVLLAALWCLRPSSRLYRIETNPRKAICLIAICILVLMECVTMFGINQITHPRTYAVTSSWEANDQYNDLADAFLDGSFVLEKTPPEFLEELSNPYDPTLRNEYISEHNLGNIADSYTDYCYYDGKFYSYFGALPALLMFAPYKLITGNDLPTWFAVLLFGFLVCISLPVLLYGLIKKGLVKQVSLGHFILADGVLFTGSGLFYLEYLPVVYSVPIVSALAFLILGLTLWVWAKGDRLNKVLLTLGSLCIAAIIACRPHLVLAVLLAFPIFWSEITRERAFFSRKGLANTCIVIVPFLVVGGIVMWYNAARFGSPLDFGANYNLTGNDMTHRGFDLYRFPVGLFSYLFQPSYWTMEYPWLTVLPMGHDYLGHLSMEPMFGGFFFFNPVALAAFAAFANRIGSLDKPARLFALASALLGFVILLIDIQASGQTARYMADFGMFIMLAAVVILFAVSNKLGALQSKNSYWWFNCCFLIAAFIGLVLTAWCLVADGRYASLISSSPTAYFMIKSCFLFLM